VHGSSADRQALAARASGYLPSNQHEVTGNPGDRLDVVLVLPGTGGALDGTVADSNGASIAAAEVRVGQRPASADWGSIDAPPVELRTDEAGRFHATGLSAGVLSVLLRARGFAPSEAKVEIVAGETTRHDFVLGPEAWVAGTVRDGSGRALEG